jgi:hypothetical protein
MWRGDITASHTAGIDHLSGSENSFKTQDIIARNAVFCPIRSTGILSDVTTWRTDLYGPGIRWIEELHGTGSLFQIPTDDTRLNHRDQIIPVQQLDSVHSIEM